MYIYSEQIIDPVFDSLKDFIDEGLPTEPLKMWSGEANGFYGKTHTEESKLLISESNKGTLGYPKGVPRSEETKLKMSQTTKGKKSFIMSEDQKEKIAKSMTGKKHNKETKRKISEALSKAQLGKKRGPYKKKV